MSVKEYISSPSCCCSQWCTLKKLKTWFHLVRPIFISYAMHRTHDKSFSYETHGWPVVTRGAWAYSCTTLFQFTETKIYIDVASVTPRYSSLQALVATRIIDCLLFQHRSAAALATSAVHLGPSSWHLCQHLSGILVPKPWNRVTVGMVLCCIPKLGWLAGFISATLLISASALDCKLPNSDGAVDLEECNDRIADVIEPGVQVWYQRLQFCLRTNMSAWAAPIASLTRPASHGRLPYVGSVPSNSLKLCVNSLVKLGLRHHMVSFAMSSTLVTKTSTLRVHPSCSSTEQAHLNVKFQDFSWMFQESDTFSRLEVLGQIHEVFSCSWKTNWLFPNCWLSSNCITKK